MPSIALDNLIKHKPYVALTSHTQLERLILPADIIMKPIRKDFENNFECDCSFQKVYSNNAFNIFYREKEE